MSRYQGLEREALIRLLERRDAERPLGLVWERDWGKDSEVEKADALHPGYGRVFITGRRRGASDFEFLRPLGGKLQSDGAFDISRLRFA